MKIFIEPANEDWQKIIQRPVLDTTYLRDRVESILNDVKFNGDEALRRYTHQFDGVEILNIRVTEEEFENAETIPADLKSAIKQAAKNIYRFHKKQLVKPQVIETMPGVKCWRKSVAIEKVGLYIPGGTAPLFSSVLMLAIPAKIAGCPEIVICTPPNKDGKIHPAILFAAKLCGVSELYKVGGAQAIAALAFGTESVRKVLKILGPGNQFVTAAKSMVQLSGTSIDMPAGPSEVCIYADESAQPSFVAADLLSQAEHGADSQVLLICTNEQTLQHVLIEIKNQQNGLTRNQVIIKALQNSRAVVLKNESDAISLINAYAPEHLILSCKNASKVADKIINAGSVFLGNFSPESVGDYASGTNHSLPTNGFATTYSGVSVDTFVKKITYQKLSKKGLKNIAHTVQVMAHAERLDAHANAVAVRLQGIIK